MRVGTILIAILLLPATLVLSQQGGFDEPQTKPPKECPVGHTRIAPPPSRLSFEGPYHPRYFRNWWVLNYPLVYNGVCEECHMIVETDRWLMSCTNLSFFALRPTELLARFPAPGGSFRQDFNGKDLVRESAAFWSATPPQQLLSNTVAFLEQQGLKPQVETVQSSSRTYRHAYALCGKMAVDVEIMSDRDSVRAAGRSHLRFEIVPRADLSFRGEVLLGLTEAPAPRPTFDYLGGKGAEAEGAQIYEGPPHRRNSFPFIEPIGTNVFTLGEPFIEKDGHRVLMLEKQGGQIYALGLRPVADKPNTYVATVQKRDKQGRVLFTRRKQIVYKNRQITLWTDQIHAARIR